MFAYIAKFILWVFGWKVEQTIPKEKSFVIVIAPHTSNWDFIIGRLVIESLKVPQKVLMKKEMFVFPLKYVLNALGTIPIDRKASARLVDYIVDLFKEKDDCSTFAFAASKDDKALS